jgi:hypothetical protein
MPEERQSCWRSEHRTTMRRQDAKGHTLQRASPAQRSLPDARWHQHRTTHKERFGQLKAGELETRHVFCKGENGREAASPIPTRVQEEVHRYCRRASQLERGIRRPMLTPSRLVADREPKQKQHPIGVALASRTNQIALQNWSAMPARCRDRS